MGSQGLNFRSRADILFKISRMHACLLIVQHIQNSSTVENIISKSEVLLGKNEQEWFSNLQKYI